jgi:hypothetical protein
MGINFLKRTKRIMRTFKINEISAVSDPAQEPATAAIIKSQSPADVVHTHCEKLAMDIAEAYPNRTPEQSEELAKAFEEFEAELVDKAFHGKGPMHEKAAHRSR